MNGTDWASRGKTVAQLIKELRTFENQDMEVRISVDHGDTSWSISLVAKVEGRYAVLKNCEEHPVPIRHRQ